MRIRGALVVSLSLMLSGLVACGGGEPDAHTPPPPASSAPKAPTGPSQAEMDKQKADADAAAKAKADADAAKAKADADAAAAKKAEQAKSDLVTAFAGMNGKFMLAYDKSDAYKKMKTEPCDKLKADDKKDACKKTAMDDGSRMGARMAKDAKNDKLVYIEFFTTDAKGKETVTNKYQVTPAVNGASAKLTVADKTKDMGSPMTAQPAKTMPKDLTVTAIDASTLSIESADWTYGKLVFVKS